MSPFKQLPSGIGWLAPGLVLPVSLVVSSCSGQFTDANSQDSRPPTPSENSTVEPDSSAATSTGDQSSSTEPENSDPASEPSADQGTNTVACPGLAPVSAGPVMSPQLTEVSGVVAAAAAGVVWAHNDSGDQAAVYAVGLDGSDRGRYVLSADNGLAGRDIEDIARTGDHLYLADVGDNNHQRPQVQVARFLEPSPASASDTASVSQTTIDQYEVVDLVYPDHPQDAEAFVVDPRSGAMAIITKNPQEQRIYIADAPIQWGATQELRLLVDISPELDQGQVDEGDGETDGDSVIGRLQQFTATLDAITGADIRADRAMLALRTYRHVQLFTLDPAKTLDDALVDAFSPGHEPPCVAPLTPEFQGEAVAFLGDATAEVVTIAEGAHPVINLSVEQAATDAQNG